MEDLKDGTSRERGAGHVAAATGYVPVTANDFLNYDDDDFYVLSNPHVRADLTYQTLHWVWVAKHITVLPICANLSGKSRFVEFELLDRCFT